MTHSAERQGCISHPDYSGTPNPCPDLLSSPARPASTKITSDPLLVTVSQFVERKEQGARHLKAIRHLCLLIVAKENSVISGELLVFCVRPYSSRSSWGFCRGKWHTPDSLTLISILKCFGV